MCLLAVPCSAYWFRRRRYELFLVVHVVLSVLVLLAMIG